MLPIIPFSLYRAVIDNEPGDVGSVPPAFSVALSSIECDPSEHTDQSMSTIAALLQDSGHF